SQGDTKDAKRKLNQTHAVEEVRRPARKVGGEDRTDENIDLRYREADQSRRHQATDPADALMARVRPPTKEQPGFAQCRELNQKLHKTTDDNTAGDCQDRLRKQRGEQQG